MREYTHQWRLLAEILRTYLRVCDAEETHLTELVSVYIVDGQDCQDQVI